MRFNFYHSLSLYNNSLRPIGEHMVVDIQQTGLIISDGGSARGTLNSMRVSDLVSTIPCLGARGACLQQQKSLFFIPTFLAREPLVTQGPKYSEWPTFRNVQGVVPYRARTSHYSPTRARDTKADRNSLISNHNFGMSKQAHNFNSQLGPFYFTSRVYCLHHTCSVLS